MATKFYLTANTAPYTPATIRGGWNDTAGSVTRRLSSQKDGGGLLTTVARAETNSSNPYSVLLYRGVSGPLLGQSLSGTLDLLIAASESNAAADMYWHVHAWVTVGDSDSVRATLVNDLAENTSNEFPTTAVGLKLQSAAAIPGTIQDGDRLVVEIGYVARNAVTTSYTGTLHYGTQLTDDGTLASDMTLGGAITLAGHIVLSADMVELPDSIKIRNTQTAVKVLEAGSPKIRATQSLVKVLEAGSPKIRSAQIMVKVLRSPEPPDDPVTESRANNMLPGCWL